MTDEEVKAIKGLRDRGFAVVVFNQEELDGAPSDDVEYRLIELGWEVIDSLRTGVDEEY
jgi:hypothetical protein